MRKLYALLAGLCLVLASNRISAQTITPDVANFTFQVFTGNNVSFTNTSVLGNVTGERRAWWYFGDGTMQPSPPLANMQHHYNTGGTYTVCLKIYRYFNNDSTLTASVCHTLVIESATCTADFQYQDSVIVGPPRAHKVKFSAFGSNSQNRPIAYVCWNFGDGTPQQCVQATSTTTPATLLQTSHIYTQQGPFTACLRITYEGGCVAERCRVLEFPNPPPPDSCRANFERINLSGTVNPLQASFRALPWHNNNKKPVRICWQFGDGRDTCIQYLTTYTGAYTVNHTYAANGLYQVCVNILYDGGCEAHKCESIRIGNEDSCTANFVRLPSTTGNPLSVLLKALPWHNNNKKPSRICWNFGDGRDTCIEYSSVYMGLYTVPHTYSHGGAFQVCVNIRYYGGCESHKCDTVRVEQPATCGADFERIQSNTANPHLAYFRALTSNSNNRKPQRICWQFGDGRDTCITYPETYTGQYVVSHNYAAAGPYNVCVSILYYGGCEAHRCRIIEITNPVTCEADFERIQSTASNPNLAYFRALFSNSNNRKPQRICWQFGDGRDTCITYSETYLGQYVVSHNYAAPGQYNVCVNILFYGGCEARRCKIISIPPPVVTCSVNLNILTTSLNNLTRTLVATPVTSPYQRPERVCWQFGDGSDTCIMIDPLQPVPALSITHTYPGPGVYHPCVSIRYVGGCEARRCGEISIQAGNTTCGGYMRDSLIGPRTYKFKGFSIHSPGDNVLYYKWTFGDGTTALGQEVTHTFTNGGQYEVCLNIKTQMGCETRICKTISVAGSNQPTLVLTPNPVVTELHALFISTHTETVNIKIQNQFGVVVRTYTRNAVIGNNTWGFDVTTLTPGIYTFIIQSPNQLASAVFIKL